MVRAVASAGPHPGAARVEPVHLAVHLDAASPGRVVAEPSDLAAGEHRLAGGALCVSIERLDHGHAASLVPRIENRGESALTIRSVVLGLRFRGHGQRAHRMLRNGWQSWSLTEWRALDAAGEPAFPSGEWLRGMHHSVGAPDPHWAGWHESETFSVAAPAVGAGPACLVGVMEEGRAFGLLHLRRVAAPQAAEAEVRIDVELRVEARLEPGASRGLEAVRVALDDHVPRLLERFAELWGERAGARVDAPFQAGWCSWYHYFHDVTEAALRANLEALAADRSGIPIDLVQLDDGYQRELGDWLETNAKFPSGLPALAKAIREAGFRAGIWTAPFAASAQSRLLAAHPEFALADADGWLRGTLNPDWSADGWAYALDPSHEGFVSHLETLFAELVAMGFDYLKLDFLYMAAMRGRAARGDMTRAERLRAGLEAIRRGAGESAFLLGCGCPLGAAVGVVDAMRIGPDVAPRWTADPAGAIPGLEPALPATRSALQSTLARAFMHRRLWQNDPDCLMVRRSETGLEEAEAGTLAALIAVSGGMAVFSDDTQALPPPARAELRRVIELGRRVDAASPRGLARHTPALDGSAPEQLAADLGVERLRAVSNFGDAPLRAAPRELARAGRAPPERAPAAAAFAGNVSGETLAPHATRVEREPGEGRLVVFCDFDGTFSTRDVGSTLAKAHLTERRPELFGRYFSGELDAWTYAVELFDGFDFGQAPLEAFLRGIELDPGARALLAWCAERDVPFRILSDGFDYNLERLQAIHDVRFEYASNALRFEGDLWRIAPGGRNPSCHCGTGTCKRAIIRAHRDAHPDAWCVHVGNGRVSDLCGAEEADLAFAKDTLAPALRERGVFHHAFSSLDDVVGVLAAIWDPA